MKMTMSIQQCLMVDIIIPRTGYLVSQASHKAFSNVFSILLVLLITAPVYSFTVFVFVKKDGILEI